ncbi:MAG: NAD(P)-dependent oxidoreductase [Pseudomonadota bacterium]|nr:NAD(P)-dependent oxidoreductase [Pseudomonadota bacterium]QKK04894.1 MAG: NAD(P)-dependent oxidoreductase [Pseudomonadota bacterium]
MKLLLTGGSGDLGVLLTRQLTQQGDDVINLDVAPPHEAVRGEATHIAASILDRDALKAAMKDVDCVVHIAAWHGIHENQGVKNAYDFHDLNVTGTFNVFEAAAAAGVKKAVLISSTSTDDRYGLYGHTKVLNEEMARAYAHRHDMDILTLRPRAFIPPWNRAVYQDFTEWANWFWKGAVHAADVCQATLKAVNFLKAGQKPAEPAQILTIDGAYDYTADELQNWTENSFAKRYGAEAEKLAQSFGLDTARKPKILGSADAEKLIGYRPAYSLKNLLEELEKYGRKGPQFPLAA